MATAIAFAFVTDRIGAVWWLPAYLVATIGMIAVSATDFECGRIPNRIIWPTILTTAALLLLASAATGHWRQFVLSVGTALVESAFMLLIRQVRHGMGLGDVRLAGLCGLAAGWLPHGPYLALVGLFIGFVLAAVMSVVKMAAQHSGLLTTTLRIGPYLASGTLIAILWHPALVAA
jgi:leader peptidase (prepilin peptidase)/N-methyltransferase